METLCVSAWSNTSLCLWTAMSSSTHRPCGHCLGMAKISQIILQSADYQGGEMQNVAWLEQHLQKHNGCYRVPWTIFHNLHVIQCDQSVACWHQSMFVGGCVCVFMCACVFVRVCSIIEWKKGHLDNSLSYWYLEMLLYCLSGWAVYAFHWQLSQQGHIDTV